MNIAGSNNIFTIKSYEEFDVTSMNVTKEITDASGIRTITYNEYNEASSENFNGDEINHLISETQASYGRNTGYSYLEGSNLLHTLAHPNNILLSNSYEEQRNLITSMNITRGTTDIVLRSYSYDALARPLSRSCSRQGTSRNDNFTYNTRSELIQAELGTSHYAYSYDNIGNRKTAQELAEESTYEANQLNQYTDITQSETPFTPTFDADGNQTLIKTTTGIWSVSYNADNRPTSFTQAQGDQNTIIECGYDYMGRRYTKKVTTNGTVSLHQRYIYRGYLQIACVDLTRSGHPALWYITWDPTEPVATRPLAIQKNATWYTYSHDLTKNVTELYQSDGLIASTYDYSPYGAATAEGTDQPLQWSSEYHDAELALTYYNYRHYNPTDGRWINQDPIGGDGGLNLYGFVYNRYDFIDVLGLNPKEVVKPPPKVGDPIEGLPHSGQYAGEGGGNCASESFDETETFDPTLKNGELLPKEFSDRGCRRVKSSKECKKEPPMEKHVVFSVDVTKGTFPSANKPGRSVPYSYHVIGEDCAHPGTYKTKLGEHGLRVNNIKDPQKAAQEYFGGLKSHGRLIAMEMCCPCKK